MDEKQENKQEVIKIPMLPMRNIVVFPFMTTPFFIGRQQSIEALEKALATDRKVFVIAQRDPMVEKPSADDLYEVGTIGNILQIMRLPNGTIKALFEAKQRGICRVIDLESSSYSAEVEIMETIENESEPELVAINNSIKEELKEFAKQSSKNADSTEKIISGEYSSGEMADLIAPLLTLTIDKQQQLLEIQNAKERLEMIYSRIMEESEHKKVEQKLKERVQGQIGKTQKEYYLNEQMKAIQKELGAEDSKAELEDYDEKIKSCGMPEAPASTARKEIKKLKMMPPTSSEANIVRNYVDWLVSVPWKRQTEDNLSLEHAQEVLDADHWGLEKVKERIVEFIAVGNLVGNLRGPIICLVGPPGVGKSSLAKSIARAVDRKFVRMSLGGVRDEAEIRGHRRTYIGALPGKIIQSMKKAKTSNPVLLLDEIDKMGQSHMGDPASALLEVLDPEQNHEFMDHYLEVEYDLSNVMFICTANTRQDIPLPLMDRMEIITLSGYSELEKEKIALKYLVPKQMKENGLKEEQIKFGTKGVFEIIRHYTREAGVRNLERKIGKACRKAVTDIVKKSSKSKSTQIQITPKRVNSYLGIPKYEYGKPDKENEVGVINGLAWTSFGGEILTIEVNTMKGTGKIQLTGKLGDVMKESAQAAHSYVRSHANELGIYSKVFTEMDIHLHVPEGATPKDGPSAGVAITCALVSALTGIPIRKDIALTGEITLRGKILPIGGLKEKLLAAKRACLAIVVIPAKNEKDLVEVSKEITKDLDIKPFNHVSDAIDILLERSPHAVNDDDFESEVNQKSEIQSSHIEEFPKSENTISHN
ncbi:MAG: endopeptidase La [Deltaproteobacteria bacterium]|nr:endopeptidase La [Deltaproteobacteria bacterium]